MVPNEEGKIYGLHTGALGFKPRTLSRQFVSDSLKVYRAMPKRKGEIERKAWGELEYRWLGFSHVHEEKLREIVGDALYAIEKLKSEMPGNKYGPDIIRMIGILIGDIPYNMPVDLAAKLLARIPYNITEADSYSVDLWRQARSEHWEELVEVVKHYWLYIRFNYSWFRRLGLWYQGKMPFAVLFLRYL